MAATGLCSYLLFPLSLPGTPSPALPPLGLTGYQRENRLQDQLYPVKPMPWVSRAWWSGRGLVISQVWESWQAEAWYWPIIFPGQLSDEMTSHLRWDGPRKEGRGEPTAWRGASWVEVGALCPQAWRPWGRCNGGKTPLTFFANSDLQRPSRSNPWFSHILKRGSEAAPLYCW